MNLCVPRRFLPLAFHPRMEFLGESLQIFQRAHVKRKDSRPNNVSWRYSLLDLLKRILVLLDFNVDVGNLKVARHRGYVIWLAKLKICVLSSYQMRSFGLTQSVEKDHQEAKKGGHVTALVVDYGS